MANRLMECSPFGVRLAVDQGQIKGLSSEGSALSGPLDFRTAVPS